MPSRTKWFGPPVFRGEGVLISEVFANRSGLDAGDRYRAEVGSAVIDLPILGVFRDYRTNGGAVYMNLDAFQEMTRDTRWGVRFFQGPGGLI